MKILIKNLLRYAIKACIYLPTTVNDDNIEPYLEDGNESN